MTRKSRPLPRFGVFAEGSNDASVRSWVALSELWKELARLHGVERKRVDVHGFHKGHIEMMDAELELEPTGALALDAQIALAYDEQPFDILIVAFDALPENQKLREETGCLAEMRWVFERFVARSVLPRPFLDDSERLLEHYSVEENREPRARAYAPRVDAIFMEPEFEALVVCDEGLVRRALEVGPNPRPWPKFKKQPPKVVLERAVDAAGPNVRRRVRGDTKSNRHSWALEIVRQATESDKFKQHGIMRRLQSLLES
jgi:hypothetical protein